MNETGQTLTCSRCGAPLTPETLKGLCGRCLLELNLGPQTEATGQDVGSGGTRQVEPPRLPLPSIQELSKLFPQLEIVECLGHGGMGAVYKARQPKLDRLVALKLLLRRREDGTPDAAFAERFAREARALARLNHPEIVTVYEYGEAGGFPYLVMEYVDGLTLRQVIQGGKLTPEQALAIVPKICDALQFAHQRGIVHRDIKPENILLDKEGHVKIADFGIAKILAPGAQDQSLTGGKDVVGTPHYMAPEQIEQPGKVDHRADIFSLGVVFYEMLTGELPLGKFQPPSRKVQVDVRLDQVVLHALEKEPERRYQHASEVKSDVQTIAGGPEALSGGDPTSRASRAQRAIYTSMGLGFASACFVLAALISAGSKHFAAVLLNLLAAAGFGFAAWRVWDKAGKLRGAPAGRQIPPFAGSGTGGQSLPPWALVARWAARIIGSLWVLTYFVFVIGEGSPPLGSQPPAVQIDFTAIVLMLVGMVAGWRRDSLGALLGFAGWMLFHAAEGNVRAVSLFHVPAVAAVLFAIAWAARLRSRRALAIGIAVVTAAPFVFSLAVNAIARHAASAELTVVWGMVTDARTGQPIAAARVDDNRYGASPTSPPRYTYTLANGTYELKTAYEEHTMAASAPGYMAGLATLLTRPFALESRVELNFYLEPTTNSASRAVRTGVGPNWLRAVALFNDIEDAGHEFDAAFSSRNLAAAKTCVRRLLTSLTDFNAAVRGTDCEFPAQVFADVLKVRKALEGRSWEEVERAAKSNDEIASAFQRIGSRMVEIARQQNIDFSWHTNR